MITSTADLQALQLALKMETDGYKFFKDASSKVTNVLAKNTLTHFADWELEHVEFIKKMHQELRDNGKWLSVEKMSQKKGDAFLKIKTIFKQTHEKIGDYVKLDTSDLDAYKLARDIEDKAVVFYQQQLKLSSNSLARKFYELMIDLEREHYQILDNSYRYFENPSQFNLEEENWMFDGG